MTDRTKAPEIYSTEHIQLATPSTRTSDSGIPFYFIENIPEDAVKITLEFAAGKMYQNRSLQAGFTADLLLSGTATKTQQEIQESIDFFGGYVQSEMAMERSSLTIYGLKKNIASIFEIVKDAFFNATFPEDEFERHRTIEKQKFIVNMEKNAVKARKLFINHLFQGTPFHSNADIPDFDEISRQDCIDFYESYFKQCLIDVNVVGNLDDTFKEKLINDLSPLKINIPTPPAFELHPETGFFEEKKEKALQTAIRIGKPLFTPEHPDYIAFDVVNTLLGGYFGSRLMSNIREDKGYTYGIGSGVVSMKSLGYFYIATEVGVEVKEDALFQIRHEIERLQTELVTEEELELVRNYMIGQMLKSTDGPFAMMNQFLFLNWYELDTTYFDTYMKTIQTISPEQIRELAQKYLKWETFSIITVG